MITVNLGLFSSAILICESHNGRIANPETHRNALLNHRAGPVGTNGLELLAGNTIWLKPKLPVLPVFDSNLAILEEIDCDPMIQS